MVTWQRKGSAVVGALKLLDGRVANAVIVGPASNPKGVSILVPKGDGADTAALSEMLDAFHPEHIVDILCMQERLHGGRSLEAPPELVQETS